VGVEDVDEYARRLISWKAKQLVGKAGFTESDREDIEQELTLDLLERLPNYDPSRASKHTFIARVVAHKIARLIERRTAAKRDHSRAVVSLSELVGLEEVHLEPRAATVEEGGTGAYRSRAKSRDLAFDLAELLQNLPEELRTLCERLKTQSVSDVCRETGVPRSTIYEWMKRLRGSFSERGLDKYL